MAKAQLLLFNIQPDKLNKLRMLAAMLGIRVIMAEKKDYLSTIGELAAGNIHQDAETELGAEQDSEALFDDEMMVMCNLNPMQFNRLLDDYKKFKLKPIMLKAILTDTNAGWTPKQLRDELSAERDAIAKGAKAHGQ